MYRVAVLLSIWAVMVAHTVSADTCEISEEQFSSDLTGSGYGAFLEKTESGMEAWLVELPKQFKGFHLHGVGVERTVKGELAFHAYLNERRVENIVWASFLIQEQERSQYTVKAMYPKHPGLDDACIHVFETSLNR